MLRRRVLSLLAVVFGLTLVSATAFAHDHDRDWNRHHGYRRDADHNWRNDYREHHRYNRYENFHRSYWSDRCVDRDHDGDCDFIRHRHHRYYQSGYYQNGWYGNPNYSNRGIWRDYPNTASRNGAWQNGRWGNGNVPPGWQRGRKRGWGDSSLPPGLAKKSGWSYR